MKIQITISPKDGIVDPQDRAIQDSLIRIGFTGVSRVRQAKLITVDADIRNPVEAKEDAVRMCQRLLANPVTEDYLVEVVDTDMDRPEK